MNIISISPEVMWNEDLFLRKPSRELNKNEVLSEDFRKLVKYMFHSLYSNPIGVGLAAPQLGIQIKLVIIDIKRNAKAPLVLINPRFVPIDNELVDSTETCLSFPSLSGKVQRFKRVKVFAKDINFEDIEFESDTFLAIVCQHEIDHLDGKVYIDKATEVFVPNDRYEIMAQNAITNISN